MDSAYIGIDPGSPLYMAMVSPRGRWVAHAGEDQFAVKAKRGVTNSPEAFVKVLRDWSGYYAKKGVQVEVVIENVGPRPGEGIISASRFAGSVWMARGATIALGLPYTMVTPQVWKRHYKIKSDKEFARDLAKKLFPSRAWRLQYKKDHNYAEAALLARYLWEVRNTVTGV